mgnify:CR=1 FL=1
MAGTYLGLPFDEELFFNEWQNEPDTYKTAMMDSGAVVYDADIAAKIAGGSSLYTVPFYNTLPNTEPVNYDGKTDIVSEETGGDALTGIVYGRAKGWSARDFIPDFHKADPMGSIISQVARYWDKYHEKTVLAIIEALFGCTPTDSAIATAWALHKTDLSAASGTVSAANKLSDASIADAAVKACGDNANGMFSLAFMHSTVANNLAKLNLLEYRKYTDINGIERQLPIADINGYTVITDDALVDNTGSAPKYTTYLLGSGAIRTADAPVKKPVEADRKPEKNGGEDLLYTRLRKTFHSNGFTWTGANTNTTGKDLNTISPTLKGLSDVSNYDLKFDPKAIALAKVVSNG